MKLSIFSLVFLAAFVKVQSTEEFDLDAVIIKVKDQLVQNGTAAHNRNKREISSQKLHHEECGKVKIQPQYGIKFASFLKNLVTGKLMDKKPAFQGEFPFVAALLVKKKGQFFYCGGSLIDHWHVLTAASCVARMDADDLSRLKVILGSQDLYNPYEIGRKEIGVSQVAYHKGFDSIDMENNIAIVRLKEAVIYSQVIQPICLPNKSSLNNEGNEMVTISGWGQMFFDPMKFLHKLDLKTWTNKKCSEMYGKKATEFLPKIRDDNLCAGNQVSQKMNLCQGNNGSPLAIYRQRRYELVGISSWSVGIDSYPCVFVKVSSFLPWIKRNTKLIK